MLKSDAHHDLASAGGGLSSEAATEIPGLEVDKLDAVFRRAGLLPDGGGVGSLHVEPIGTGQMADTVRCRVMEQGTTGGGLPSSFVVKLPVAEGQTAITARHAGVYDREFRFYEVLRPEIPTLQCPEYYGAYDVDGEPALVLEDAPGIQGDQIGGATIDQARQAVGQLAGIQGRWWADDVFGRQTWLQRRVGVPISERRDRYNASWHRVKSSVQDDLIPGAVEIIEDYGERCDAWSQSYSGPMCLAHHDYRLDNILFGDDRVWVVDWQTLGWGPPAWDLAYFIGSSLTVADRREYERELVTAHAVGLRDQGVSDWTDDIAWEAYRQMAFGVFLLTVPAAGEVRSSERARQMFVAMWNRAAAMVMDLDSTEFLER